MIGREGGFCDCSVLPMPRRLLLTWSAGAWGSECPVSTRNTVPPVGESINRVREAWIEGGMAKMCKAGRCGGLVQWFREWFRARRASGAFRGCSSAKLSEFLVLSVFLSSGEHAIITLYLQNLKPNSGYNLYARYTAPLRRV